jgi:hypothetical protein
VTPDLGFRSPICPEALEHSEDPVGPISNGSPSDAAQLRRSAEVIVDANWRAAAIHANVKAACSAERSVVFERALTGGPATIARRRPASAFLQAPVRTTNGCDRRSSRRATAAMNQRECPQQ